MAVDGKAATALFGPTLATKDGDKPTADVLGGKKGVMIYFSAHWCPPCRGFTPKLTEYHTKHAADKNFEIVFVSSDRDEGAFKEYHGEMAGMLALPYADRERKATLSKKYSVQGIPSLVVLDDALEVATKNGRAKVMEDEDCAGFPWPPLTFAQCLGDKLIKKSGDGVDTAAAIRGKTVGIYFSAHWCPPCRDFTPKLAQFYKAYKAVDPNFEIIFSSGDRDKAGAEDYFKNDHGDYLMIPYEHKEGRSALDEKYEVEGIPTFVIVDDKGRLINKDGRGKAGGGAAAVPKTFDPKFWEPPLLGDLAEGPGCCGTDINETKTLLVLMWNQDDDEQAAAEKVLMPLAQEHVDKGKASGDSPELIIIVSKSGGGMADQIGALTKKNGGAKCQNLCSDGNPQLLLFDIPSGGKFYVDESGAGEVTAEGVKKFLAAPGEGKQMER